MMPFAPRHRRELRMDACTHVQTRASLGLPDLAQDDRIRYKTIQVGVRGIERFLELAGVLHGPYNYVLSPLRVLLGPASSRRAMLVVRCHAVVGGLLAGWQDP
jgi:hypothetical protein